MDVDDAWRLEPGSRVRSKSDGRVLNVVRVLQWTQGPLVWCSEEPASHPEPWLPEQIELLDDLLDDLLVTPT